MMLKPLPLALAFRFLTGRGRLVSFIAVIAIGGITLGVMVLVTVLSVMNGFESTVSQRLLALGGAITVTPVTGTFSHWNDVSRRLKHFHSVTAVAPFVQGQGLLLHGQRLAPVSLQGIDPTLEKRVSNVGKHVVKGTLSALKPNSKSLFVGKALAEKYHLKRGQAVTLLTPASSGSGAFLPVLHRFHVVGIYSIGMYQVEQHLVYANLATTQKLFRVTGVDGLHLRLADPMDASRLSQRISSELGAHYQVTSWAQSQANLFATIGLQKRMLFVVLAAIIAVAAFSIVSTLVVMSMERASEVAILVTLGLGRRQIQMVFWLQGFLLGMVGTLIGVALGILLALQVNHLLDALNHLFNTQLLPPSVYLITELPARFEWVQILTVAGLSVLLSLIATFYPAWRASRLQPAKVLQGE